MRDSIDYYRVAEPEPPGPVDVDEAPRYVLDRVLNEALAELDTPGKVEQLERETVEIVLSALGIVTVEPTPEERKVWDEELAELTWEFRWWG